LNDKVVFVKLFKGALRGPIVSPFLGSNFFLAEKEMEQAKICIGAKEEEIETCYLVLLWKIHAIMGSLDRGQRMPTLMGKLQSTRFILENAKEQIQTLS